MVRILRTLFVVASTLGVALAAQSSGAEDLTTTFSDCRDCPTMAKLPAGRFVIGASNQQEIYGPAQWVRSP